MSYVTDTLNTYVSYKPNDLIVSDLKWKYLIRSILNGSNIMIVGPAGTGKTQLVYNVANVLQKEHDFFVFNLGSTQDPRLSLIGNTSFNREIGTFFNKSAFIKAIETPGAIILLDEISRAHPEAWNILMSILDVNQRYVRLDETDDKEVIHVAPGVSFIATANIGNEYTATRIMDRALRDRFTVTIEMDNLTKNDQYKLLRIKFPTLSLKTIDVITDIYQDIYNESVSDANNHKLSHSVSTRTLIEFASLINDGFTLSEAMEVTILPMYSPLGGVNSERTVIKQIFQRYIINKTIKNDNTLNTLFSKYDINNSILA